MKDSGYDEDIASGFRGLDGEHRLQLDLLGSLRTAIAEGRSREDVDEIFDRLIDYTRVHFASEQTLMRLYQYPHAAQHTEDHDGAVQHLQEMRSAQLDGDEGLAIEVADRLTEALTRHILTSDRALGFFLVRLGVGPG